MLYSAGINTTVTTSAAAAADIKAGSGNRPKLMEICLLNAAATESNYNFGVSGNTTVAQTTPALVQAEDPNAPAGLTGTAVAWGTAPTIPTTIYRMFAVQGSISAGIIYVWPRGLALPTNGASLVLWNRQANSANMNINITVDE